MFNNNNNNNNKMFKKLDRIANCNIYSNTHFWPYFSGFAVDPEFDSFCCYIEWNNFFMLANIVVANSSTFLPFDEANFATVF